MSGVLLWLGVGVFGGVGAITRFVVDRLVLQAVGARVPAGTFVINVSGSVVLGVFAGLVLRGDALLLAGTAVIGSYTTFSTWMFESQRLTEDGRPWTALLNVVASVVLGVAGAAAGRWVAG